ncbi:MAG TPA: hypothetical protein VFE62_07265 [Gemmataceae bacterium]|nr:hypothetical protein [Gemmataceae bacterium]
MQINDSLSQPSIVPFQQTAGAAPVPASGGGVEGVPSDVDGYTPSAELVRLISLAGQEPEIREDKVAAVLQRLQSGAYLSAESVAQTADAMINSLD